MQSRFVDQVPVAAPPRSGPPAVEVIALHKRYGATVALHELTLTVEPGEVFGFLGPNGAGKTTTMKILAGLVHPSAGEARVHGTPVSRPDARRCVGYLPEHFRFPDWMTGEELLDLHGRLAGLGPAARRHRIPEVLARVGLADRGQDRIGTYSLGMTQRVGLAQALIGEPDVVLLDEPTSALDPVGRREVRDLIRALREDGVTVFLNSHLLSEVEVVCDRVAIVDSGRVVRCGPLAEVVAGRQSLRLDVDHVDDALLVTLSRFGLVHHAGTGSLRLDVDDLACAVDVADAVVLGGYRLFALAPELETLEDVFVRLVASGDR